VIYAVAAYPGFCGVIELGVKNWLLPDPGWNANPSPAKAYIF